MSSLEPQTEPEALLASTKVSPNPDTQTHSLHFLSPLALPPRSPMGTQISYFILILVPTNLDPVSNSDPNLKSVYFISQLRNLSIKLAGQLVSNPSIQPLVQSTFYTAGFLLNILSTSKSAIQ